MFNMASDAASKLVEISYTGFLDAETVSASFEAEQRIVTAMGCQTLEHLLLVDARSLAVLPKEVVAHVVATLGTRPLRARRAAVVAGSVLSNLQLKRIVSQESDVRMFAAREAAMSWLLAETDA